EDVEGGFAHAELAGGTLAGARVAFPFKLAQVSPVVPGGGALRARHGPGCGTRRPAGAFVSSMEVRLRPTVGGPPCRHRATLPYCALELLFPLVANVLVDARYALGLSDRVEPERGVAYTQKETRRV